MKDLAHYSAAFQSYLNSPLRSPEQEVALLSPTLEIIQNLRKVCSLCMHGLGEEKQTNIEIRSSDLKTKSD